jgi:hypothetical protein
MSPGEGRNRPTQRCECPCGCVAGVDCAAGRPVADVDGHCCGSLSVEQINTAVRLGIHCARGCVARRLGAAS